MKKEFKPDVKPHLQPKRFCLPSVDGLKPPSSITEAQKMLDLGTRLMRAGMNQIRMAPESRHILSLAMSSVTATAFSVQSLGMSSSSSPAAGSRYSSSPTNRSYNSPRDSGGRSYNSSRVSASRSDRSREESGSDRSYDDARRRDRDYRSGSYSGSSSHQSQSEEDRYRSVKRERFDEDYDKRRDYDRRWNEDRRGSRERSSGHRRY